MANPADLVRDACTLLLGYIPQAESEVTETSSSPGGPVGMSPRSAAAPLPGNQQALLALMTVWEAIPRTEARLRYDITGHPGPRRGGSEGNFRESMAALPKLAAGLSEDGEAAVARWLEHLANQLRVLPAIDEAQRWRPVPSRACPYCGCWFLKVLLDARGQPAGHVECHTVGCRDGNGLRPVAGMGTDDHGRPVLAWADGLTETAPDLDG